MSVFEEWLGGAATQTHRYCDVESLLSSEEILKDSMPMDRLKGDKAGAQGDKAGTQGLQNLKRCMILPKLRGKTQKTLPAQFLTKNLERENLTNRKEAFPSSTNCVGRDPKSRNITLNAKKKFLYVHPQSPHYT